MRPADETKRPAYLKIYEALRGDITSGAYALGERVPSKRTMAEQTDTSVITVEHAYNLLIDEGYIEARERSGYFVCYRSEDAFPVGDVSDDADGQHADGTPSGSFATTDMRYRSTPSTSVDTADGRQAENSTSRLSEEAAGGTMISALAQAEGVPATDQYEAAATELSFAGFARTMRHVLSEYAEECMQRSPNEGTLYFRESIARYLQRSRGIHVDVSQIIVGAGSEYLYSLIVQMLGRERVYALEDPSYEKIRRVYEANGAHCELLKLGHHGIHSSELRRSDAGVLHVTPFDSYPSGVTATAGKRQEYISWAKQRQAMIIEDDYASEFSPSTKSEDTLFSLAPEETVIYMNTFTKTISPAIRTGYMLLPRKRAAELKAKISFYSCTVPTYDQYVLAEYLNSGAFERYINRVRRKRRQDRKKLI